MRGAGPRSVDVSAAFFFAASAAPDSAFSFTGDKTRRAAIDTGRGFAISTVSPIERPPATRSPLAGAAALRRFSRATTSRSCCSVISRPLRSRRRPSLTIVSPRLRRKSTSASSLP